MFRHFSTYNQMRGGGIHRSDRYVMRGSGFHTSSQYEMRGSGIGSIFSNIFRSIVPFAKRLFGFGKQVIQSSTGQQVLKAAKRTAVDAGLNIAHDTLNGVPLKKAAKKGLKKAKTDFAMNIDKELQGGKRKKKTTSIKSKSKTIKKSINERKNILVKSSKLFPIRKKKASTKKKSQSKKKPLLKKKPKSSKKKKTGGACKKQCHASLLKLW